MDMLLETHAAWREETAWVAPDREGAVKRHLGDSPPHPFSRLRFG